MITSYVYAARAIVGDRDEQEDACAFAVIGRERPRSVAKAEASRQGAEGASEAHGRGLLAILADGMGGHVGGRRASTTACEAFVAACLAGEASGANEPNEVEVPNTAGVTDKTSVAPQETGAAREDLAGPPPLAAALEAANEAIASEIARDPSLRGMGCTLVAAYLDGKGVRWISVGDSLLFLYRRGRLERLNADHSMAPVLDDLVRRGLMDPFEATLSPRRHLLRSALTGQPLEIVEHRDETLPLEAHDWLILASDGLETLSDAELEGLLAEVSDESPDRVVEALLERVEARGALLQDNTTVMAIQPRFDETGATAHARGKTADADAEPGEGLVQTVRLTQLG